MDALTGWPLLVMIIPIFISFVWYLWRADMLPLSQCKHLPISVSNVLLVTAHPDDESMFFGPTLINLKKRESNIFILCLSDGNHYGHGDKRKQELLAAAKIFDISFFDTVIPEEPFPDGPNEVWDEKRIQSVVLDQIRRHRINAIITFDTFGVSGHPNHKAVAESLSKFAKTFDFEVYHLETVSILRKYLSFIDLLFTCFSMSIFGYEGRYFELVSVSDVQRIKSGLREHKSQMVWFRSLYMMFSRYFMINTFIKGPQ